MSDPRKRVYSLLEPGETGDRASRAVDAFLIALILVNGAISILETVPGIFTPYRTPLFWFEAGSVAVFTVEYALRLWSCTATGRSPIWGRLRYALHPMLLIDLVAILPFFLYFLGLDLRVARVLRLTRFFRIAKLGRYSRALRLLAAAVSARKEELLISLMMGFFALVFSATLIYYAEHDLQPEVFSSIPASFWWAVTTLTTVGYGDAVPMTLLGRIFGALVQIIGVGFLALPTGLMASAFLEQMQARKAAAGEGDAGARADPPRNCPHCGKAIG